MSSEISSATRAMSRFANASKSALTMSMSVFTTSAGRYTGTKKGPDQAPRS